MVNWKVVLIAIVIAILLVAAGMWFGYRYVSDQDDIPLGWQPSSDVTCLPSDILYSARIEQISVAYN